MMFLPLFIGGYLHTKFEDSIISLILSYEKFILYYSLLNILNYLFNSFYTASAKIIP